MGTPWCNPGEVATLESPPTRRYRSDRRTAQARQTLTRIVAAATDLFLRRGYAATTMPTVARAAGVSVPTIEAAFGTKARLLRAAIDAAIAGDDEPVPVLDRAWAASARRADTVEDFAEIVARVVGPAQERSAGLVLALFEGAASDPELAALSERIVDQRRGTAGWLVDALAAKASLASDYSREGLIDTVWILMDPALYDRLTRQRHWSRLRYEHWFARALRRLLTEPRSPAIQAEEAP
jgi:AcrR family transcriptional regulator